MADNYFKVIKPGVFTLIQDAGRFGQAAMGLTTGGPMDSLAFQWANRICGNALDAATLEVSLGGLVLQVQASTAIAVTGAELSVQVNGMDAAMWQSVAVNRGDIVKLGFAKSGVRSYLAVAGGFQISTVFGSVATVVREALGGLNGGPLQEADLLPCENVALKKSRLAEKYRPTYGTTAQLRVIPGYQYKAFSRDQKRRVFNHQYRVTTQSDRMGFRLKGSGIKAPEKGLLSEGICLGAIQIPPDGQPIVLMKDRQSIGGYPKMGTVLSVDLDKLAQLTPGSTVQFVPVTPSLGRNIVLQQHQAFANTPLSFRAS